MMKFDKETLFEILPSMLPILIMFFSMVLPQDFRGPVMFLGIPLIFVAMWMQELAVRDKINKFPHLMMIVRPKKKMYHLYIKSGRSKEIAPSIYSTILSLEFPITIEEAEGEIKQIKLNHAGRFNERVTFNPSQRLAKYYGQWVDHPQSEIIEVHRELHQGRLTIKRGQFIPTYILDLGSKDQHVQKGRPLLSSSFETPNCEKSCKKMIDVNRELIEYKSQAALFHEDSASYGEIIDQKEVETRGLIKAKTGGVDYAIELLLALYRACGTIDKTIKQLKGKMFKFEPWMLIPITAIIGFLYIQLNPGAGATISEYLSDPNNQGFIIVVIVALGALVYWVGSKKRLF